MPGSSPRVWGTLFVIVLFLVPLRFIPTGVGNTGAAIIYASDFTVHPHGCGEHFFMMVPRHIPIGSSPRVWGTQQNAIIYTMEKRFIPTGVGNTLVCDFVVLCLPVHPHGCGEHTNTKVIHRQKTGSSPRVWGTRIDSMA